MDTKTTLSHSEYVTAYKKEKYKRIPVEVPKDKYAEIKAAADRAGSSVNKYIIAAIDEKIARDSSGVV